MKKFDLEEKFPRIVIVKISEGFLVGIFPENKELQKLMGTYMKDIMAQIQNFGDGDEWKQKMETSINKVLENQDDSVKLFACKDALEVMAIIAPLPEGDKPKSGKPNLSWFWSDLGHIPE